MDNSYHEIWIRHKIMPCMWKRAKNWQSGSDLGRNHVFGEFFCWLSGNSRVILILKSKMHIFSEKGWRAPAESDTALGISSPELVLDFIQNLWCRAVWIQLHIKAHEWLYCVSGTQTSLAVSPDVNTGRCTETLRPIEAGN